MGLKLQGVGLESHPLLGVLLLTRTERKKALIFVVAYKMFMKSNLHVCLVLFTAAACMHPVVLQQRDSRSH